MIRSLHRPPFPHGSPGNARQPIIVALLVISAGLGIWTYWPQIENMISPGPKSRLASARAPAGGSVPRAAGAPKLRTVSSTEGVKPRKAGAEEEKSKPLLATEESAPDEPEGNLPEKLTTIKISEGDEIKRLERQLVAQRKKDEPSAIADFLRAARITGVRVAGPMSKLLFNGQVYEVGDVVRDNPRIVIGRITKTQVVFEDAGGKEYPVRF